MYIFVLRMIEKNNNAHFCNILKHAACLHVWNANVNLYALYLICIHWRILDSHMGFFYLYGSNSSWLLEEWKTKKKCNTLLNALKQKVNTNFA